MLDKAYKAQPLRNLAESKLVLVSGPEAIATCRPRVVTDSVTVKAAVIVSDLSLKLLDVQGGIWAINTRGTHAALHLESGIFFHFAHSLS